MPKFMIAYYGGRVPRSKEEGTAQLQKWKDWIAELGDAIIDPGTPLPTSKIVTIDAVQDDDNSDAMKGFAVVQAENIDAAVAIAQSDPFLQNGGTIRVSAMMAM